MHKKKKRKNVGAYFCCIFMPFKKQFSTLLIILKYKLVENKKKKSLERNFLCLEKRKNYNLRHYYILHTY